MTFLVYRCDGCFADCKAVFLVAKGQHMFTDNGQSVCSCPACDSNCFSDGTEVEVSLPEPPDIEAT